MGNIRERVAAEYEAIERALLSTPSPGAVASLSTLELAGTAAYALCYSGGILAVAVALFQRRQAG